MQDDTAEDAPEQERTCAGNTSQEEASRVQEILAQIIPCYRDGPTSGTATERPGRGLGRGCGRQQMWSVLCSRGGAEVSRCRPRVARGAAQREEGECERDNREVEEEDAESDSVATMQRPLTLRQQLTYPNFRLNPVFFNDQYNRFPPRHLRHAAGSDVRAQGGVHGGRAGGDVSQVVGGGTASRFRTPTGCNSPRPAQCSHPPSPTLPLPLPADHHALVPGPQQHRFRGQPNLRAHDQPPTPLTPLPTIRPAPLPPQRRPEQHPGRRYRWRL